MIKLHKNRYPRGLACIVMIGLFLSLGSVRIFAVPDNISARLLELKPISPQRIGHLSKEARHQYELGLNAVDKINYPKSLDYFTRATEEDPDDVYLRFMVVQMSQYLGDTRTGAESVKYYDVALANLKKIFESPKLNSREKERARNALELISAMRQAVSERDETRHQYGMNIAKRYVKEAFKPTEKEQKALKKKKLQTQIQQAYGKKKPKGTASGTGDSLTAGSASPVAASSSLGR